MIKKNASPTAATIKQVRERLEISQQLHKKGSKHRKVPSQLFLSASPRPEDALLQSTFVDMNEDHATESVNDWKLIFELCKHLDDVIRHGNELMQATSPEMRDRLAEYSFRAGSFIAQMILSELRTLNDVIVSIDGLLLQYKQEVLQQNRERLSSGKDALRRPPSSFKDFLLQETDVLSALVSFSTSKSFVMQKIVSADYSRSIYLQYNYRVFVCVKAFLEYYKC